MVENEYNRGKVDNEIDLCAVTDIETKNILEKAFLADRVSFFVRWDTPGFWAKIFSGAKPKIVFCVNSEQLMTAEEALEKVGLKADQIEIIKKKSRNKQGY